MRGIYLIYANLEGAELSGADLRTSNLTGADLTDADLSSADLNGACKYIDDSFTKTRLVSNEELEQQAASLEGATMPDGSKHP
jgi:uncharacterized protein YjbI with pentapeptide repeats